MSSYLAHKYSELRALLGKGIVWYRGLSTSSKVALWVAVGLHQLFGFVFWFIGPKKVFGCEWNMQYSHLPF